MQIKCLEHWHEIVNTGNKSGLDSLLDDNVVFYSPVVHSPQVGKRITHQYLCAALDVLVNESFQYTGEMRNECQAALEFVVDLAGITVNGVDLISWNSAQKITQFKVMIRPLKAINLVHTLMAEKLVPPA